MSSTSESSGDGDRPDDDDDDGDDGLTGFRWGFGRWGFGKSLGDAGGSDEAGPSRMDFAMNFSSDAGGFVAGEEDELDDEVEYYDDPGDEGDEEGEYDFEDGGYAQDDVLYPGLYRALYGFEPEGTAEMKLEEDQTVRVVGRGGGVGWAVVIKEDGGHALVPESYLEPVTIDEEEEGSGE
jgi:hypothetical protein